MGGLTRAKMSNCLMTPAARPRHIVASLRDSTPLRREPPKLASSLRGTPAAPLRVTPKGVGGYDLASLREGGGAALAEFFSSFVFAPSRSRDGGSLRVMNLYLGLYKVLNITKSFYKTLF